jgi:hypothetical protein
MPRAGAAGGRVPSAGRKSNFSVIDLTDLAPARKERKLSPRQIEALARQKTVADLLNDAASQPASKAAVWDFGKQSPANVRNALAKVVESEPRDLYASVRGTRLIVSKSSIPSGRSIFLGKRK